MTLLVRLLILGDDSKILEYHKHRYSIDALHSARTKTDKNFEAALRIEFSSIRIPAFQNCSFMVTSHVKSYRILLCYSNHDEPPHILSYVSPP